VARLTGSSQNRGAALPINEAWPDQGESLPVHRLVILSLTAVDHFSNFLTGARYSPTPVRSGSHPYIGMKMILDNTVSQHLRVYDNFGQSRANEEPV